MIGTCQLCGARIESKYVPTSDDTAELIKAVDNIAAYMWLHISESHPNQANEGTLQMQRAAKLYGLNWTNFAEQHEQAKVAWRATFQLKLTHTTALQADFGPDAPPAAAAAAADFSAGASSDVDPSGSNVKKSARNSSN